MEELVSAPNIQIFDIKYKKFCHNSPFVWHALHRYNAITILLMFTLCKIYFLIININIFLIPFEDLTKIILGIIHPWSIMVDIIEGV